MPITKNEDFGTNWDGSTNKDYCVYCYKDGKFIDDVSMEEYIKMNVKYAYLAGMSEEEMKVHCQKVFPTLKRWQKTL